MCGSRGPADRSSGLWDLLWDLLWDRLVVPVIVLPVAVVTLRRDTRDTRDALLTTEVCDCGEPGERDLAEHGDRERGDLECGDWEWEWDREEDREPGVEPRKPR